ncbi:MAG: hypothetical protein M1839_002232 [Geoglossum umbratile]|nr:MAG: hypothetical protein M1839_002232 [Geoglossum umbratile]
MQTPPLQSAASVSRTAGVVVGGIAAFTSPTTNREAKRPLCDSCNGITPARLATPGIPRSQRAGYRHSPNFHFLESSAQSCPMCQLILLAINERKPSQPPSKGRLQGPKAEIWLIGSPAATSGQPPRLSQVFCGNSRMSGYLNLYTKEDDPAALSGDLVEKGLDTDSASDRNFKLASQWLCDCLTKHPACRETISRISLIDDSSSRHLPTRVLDVEPQGDPKTVYLFEANGQCGQYVALSHCWGPKGLQETAQTKSNTLEGRKSGILQQNLPKTFRDAIVVMRRLGFRYLWIDALCILQDNVEDWEYESSQMGAYYQNAVFTIAAADAEDGSIGCFIPRDSPSPEPVMLSFPLHNNTTGHLFATLRPKISIEQSPLSQRGWTLQERILSRRILYYTKNRLYWECQTLTTSEDCKLMIHKNLRFGIINNGITTVKMGTQGLQLFNQWYLMVDSYTARKLTKDRDKLPALSGLATELQKRTHGHYLAGLWAEHLHNGLLWQAGDVKLTLPFSGPRAPSWSWAALEGPVSYEICVEDGTTIQTDAVRVLETHISVKGIDPNGEVLSGSLVLAGCMKAATVLGKKTENRITHSPTASSSMIYLGENTYNILANPNSSARIGWISLDTAEIPSTNIFCIRVSDNKNVMDRGEEVYYDSYNVLGLVSCEGGYRRVGMGEVQEEGWFEGCVEEEIRLV